MIMPNPPSSLVLFDVLLKIVQNDVGITNNLRGVPLPLLQAVFPEKYQKLQPEVSQIPTKPDNVDVSIPGDSELTLMMSGGLGSTASLWRILTSGKECKILFAENMFSKNLETVKRKFIKELMLDGKASNGTPLATGSKEEGYRTWIKSLIPPRGANVLPRRARILLLTSLAYEQSLTNENVSEPLSLVWGSVYDCFDLFEQMKMWNVRHIVPFPNRETALFCLAHGEMVTDTLISKHYVTPREITPDCMLVFECLNHVCSCWDNHSDTDVVFEPRTEVIDKPFLEMCGKCKGCARWFEAVDILRNDMPNIKFGTKRTENGDEDRYWKTAPTLTILPKRSFALQESTPAKATKKTKGRPKKAKLSLEEAEEEKEDEEKDDQDNDDENEIESEEESESEDDFGYEIEEEEEEQVDEDVEIPDGLLENSEDEGYDSDAGKKKRKRKKS